MAKKKKIPIVRFDINLKKSFNLDLYTGDVPTLYFYHEGNYWRWDEKMPTKDDIDIFLNWMNKIIFPIVQLNNEEEVDTFFDVKKEWQENTPFFKKSPYKPYGDTCTKSNAKTRVLVFMYDKEDFSDELDIIRRAGRFSARRHDLRIGIVTDGKTIKRFKSRFGSLYFPEGAHTSIVLKRDDEKTFMYDLMAPSAQPMDMNYWINRKSLKDVT